MMPTPATREKNDNLSYDSRAIANWFLLRAGSDNYRLSLLKLLKLVFFAHGFASLKFEGELVNEQFQAWKYGPVAPYLYGRFRDPNGGIYPRGTIPADVDGDLTESTRKLEGDAKTQSILEGVYREYSRIAPFALSEETHGPGTPWRRAAQRSGFYAPILQEDIIEYFETSHRLSDIGVS